MEAYQFFIYVGKIPPPPPGRLGQGCAYKRSGVGYWLYTVHCASCNAAQQIAIRPIHTAAFSRSEKGA